MDNGLFGLFNSLYRSLYDFKAYAGFKKGTMGRAFLYLFVVSMIFGIIGSVKIYMGMDQAFKDMHQTFTKDFPNFTFTKDGLEVEGKMPIISAEGNKFVTVVDTEGKVSPSVLDLYEEGIYVGKTKLIFKKNQVETREYDLSSFKELAPLTKRDVEKFFAYSWVISLFVIIFFLAFYFVAKIVNAAVVGLIGLIYSAITRSGESYGNLFKLSVYALTLPIILETLQMVTGFNIPFFFWVYFAIAAGYLIYALIRIKGSESAPEEKQG